MKASMSIRILKLRPAAIVASALASLVWLASPLAAFQFGSGELTGTFDTTVSAGSLYRPRPNATILARSTAGSRTPSTPTMAISIMKKAWFPPSSRLPMTCS